MCLCIWISNPSPQKATYCRPFLHAIVRCHGNRIPSFFLRTSSAESFGFGFCLLFSKFCLTLPSSLFAQVGSKKQKFHKWMWYTNAGIVSIYVATDFLFRENTNEASFPEGFVSLCFLGGLLYCGRYLWQAMKKEERKSHSTRETTPSPYFVRNHHCRTRNRRASSCICRLRWHPHPSAFARSESSARTGSSCFRICSASCFCMSSIST